MNEYRRTSCSFWAVSPVTIQANRLIVRIFLFMVTSKIDLFKLYSKSINKVPLNLVGLYKMMDYLLPEPPPPPERDELELPEDELPDEPEELERPDEDDPLLTLPELLRPDEELPLL